MNIAIFNTLAKSGSTGKIAYGLQCYLKAHGHNTYLLYGRQDEKVSNEETDIIRIGTNLDLLLHGAFSRLLGGEGIYSCHATKQLIEKLKELKIEAVCLLNIHGYYLNFPMLFKFLGENKLHTVYVMLDEYPMMGKCAYSYECEKFLTECRDCPQIHTYPKSLFFDSSRRMFWMKKAAYDAVPDCIFTAVGYTIARARASALLRGRLYYSADEAVDLRNLFYPRDTARLREELQIPKENKIILTVTPYPNERKGGQFFLEAARRMQDRKDISFVHVGFMAAPEICPPNYIPIGYVKDQNLLAEYYSLGDLFLQMSRAETIPAAILEALSCGTPVLGFNISGIPSTADEAHGVFVEYGNVEEIVKVISDAPIKDAATSASCRAYAESRYDSVDYNRKLMGLLIGKIPPEGRL